MVLEVGREGKKCEDYIQMVKYIQEGRYRNNLNKNSELLKLEGMLQSLSVLEIKEGDLIIRDGVEVLIPHKHREELLE